MNFSLENPNHEDLGDLLRNMVAEILSGPMKSAVYPIGKIRDRDIIVMDPYLEYLTDYIQKANETSIRFKLLQNKYYDEGEIGSGPGGWVTEIFIKGTE